MKMITEANLDIIDNLVSRMEKKRGKCKTAAHELLELLREEKLKLEIGQANPIPDRPCAPPVTQARTVPALDCPLRQEVLRFLSLAGFLGVVGFLFLVVLGG